MLSALVVAAAAFEIVALAEGVHVALVQPEPPSYAFANALIIEDDETVTVVDTHQSLEAAATLIDEIAKLTSKPVGFVINTHWHGDHVYGNQVYRDRFPGVIFIGHRATRDEMLSVGADRLAEELGSLPGSIEQRAQWLASGTGPGGEPLDEDLRQRIETSHRLRSGYLEELRALTLTPPTLTFDDELTLRRPGRTIRVLHFGPAHTRGDIVVHLPDEGIVAVGDLLEQGAFPYFGDAYPAGWEKALNGIGALRATTTIPSHGGIVRDPRLLQYHFRLLRALRHEVEVAILRGFTLDQTQEKVTLSGFVAELPGSEEGVRTAVERMYLEQTGELDP